MAIRQITKCYPMGQKPKMRTLCIPYKLNLACT
uniref:Uncharacterized protein n=1 Tax=Rhizophora mucronata TaxID=61149 RepID=A0A2P2IL63_RHIMU